MWMVMEYDQVLLQQALSDLKAQGIVGIGVHREDQLQQVNLSEVTLVIVGQKWTSQTMQKLRSEGLNCPSVYVVTSVTDTCFEHAKHIGCVDVVPYPLPISYLHSYAAATTTEVSAFTVETADTQVSTLESIMGVRSGRKSNGAEAPKSEEFALDAHRGQLIVLHSERGGIGKSLVATLFAKYLAGQGKSVVIVELDPKGNLLAMHRAQAAVTVDEWSKLPAQMDERMIRQSLLSVGGYHLLPRGHNREGTQSATVRRMIGHLTQYFDVVLVDTTPSAPITDLVLDLAQQVIYLMSPDWTMIKGYLDEYEMLKSRKGDRYIQVVVNRVRNIEEHKRTLQMVLESNMTSTTIQMAEEKSLHRGVFQTKRSSEAMEHLFYALRFERRPTASKRRWRLG